MAKYSQDGRWLRVLTPSGLGILALSLKGREAVSELFEFELSIATPLGEELDFSKLVNQSISVEVDYPICPTRYVNGIVNTLTQTHRDDSFNFYTVSIVPAVWRLTQSTHNRIFQQKSVTDILRTLFEGLSTDFNIANPTRPHNYCVQYRETDFDFAARLMEEHGLFFSFEHQKDGHKLIIADTSRNCPALSSDSKITFDLVSGGIGTKGRIRTWSKTQRIGPAKVSYRDYNFELPDQVLEASQTIPSTMQVGKVAHKLINGNDPWILHDPRGEYAHMFDGVGPTGGEQASSLQQVFEQKDQTARIRMERANVDSITIEATGDCSHMVPGYSFELAGHFDGDGKYVITEINHELTAGDYRAGQAPEATYYVNRFKCIPIDLPFRPKPQTPRPSIQGTLLATVVGPPGEEIFTDKFGRIKIQFPWDLEGKQDGQSSCWVRPFTPIAGNNYGMITIPRVGHEVLIGFIEGDPDEPIVLGSSFNPNQMPPFELPEHRTRLVFKSQTKNGDSQQFSGMAIEDAPGEEQVNLHSERDMRVNTESNHYSNVGLNHWNNVGRFNHKIVGGIPGIGGGEDDSNDNNDNNNEEGGGESENEYTGPFQWKQGDVESSVGADVAMVFGVSADITTGIEAYVTLGQKYEVLINPLGYLVGGGLLAGQFGGNFELNFASESEATYGDKFDAHHGGTTEVTGYACNEDAAIIKKAGGLFCVLTAASVAAAGGIGPTDPSMLRGLEALSGVVMEVCMLTLTALERAGADVQQGVENTEFAERMEKAAALWEPVVTEFVEKKTKAAVAAAKQAEQNAQAAAQTATLKANVAIGSAGQAAKSEQNVASAFGALAATRNVLIDGSFNLRSQGQLRISSAKLDPVDATINSNLILEAVGTPESVDGMVNIYGNNAVVIQGGTDALLGVGGDLNEIVGSVPPDGMIKLQLVDEFPSIQITEEGILIMANPDCGIAITDEGVNIIGPTIVLEGEESVTISSDETVMEISPEGIDAEGLMLDETIEVSFEMEVLTVDVDSTEVSYVYAMFEVM